MFILENKKIFFILSGMLVISSILAVSVLGLNLGIDFRGGALLEIEYVDERPEISVIEENIETLELGGFVVQKTGEAGVIIRTQSLNEESYGRLMGVLSNKEFEEKRFTSIGPVLGDELRRKAITAIIITIVTIILFVAYVFRKVSYPVKSWKYGIVAIVALFHDILIPTGMMAVLGKINGAEVDALFVTALLAILGLSVNDTIVVFDRIRENLKLKISKDFSEVVGKSLSQTISRSINTSLTTLFVLLGVYFLGPESTKNFSLILSVGLIAGTYSSIFLASPLLLVLERRQKRK